MSRAALITATMAVVFGLGVPWLGMKMLVPSLESGPLRPNYRGRMVFSGLGIAWLFWAGGAMAMTLTSFIGDRPSVVWQLVLSGALALVAFSVGVVDDAMGTAADKSFAGHVRALTSGRLTTGMLKVVGVSVASLVAAILVSGGTPWGVAVAGKPLARVVVLLLAGASIALTSNLLNLLDLRPGRALKSYTLLVLVGAVAAGIASAHVNTTLPGDVWHRSAENIVLLTIFALGPVVAVWRYDIGERGMLGDAGANAAGAVAGFFLVASVPVWGLVGYFGLVLGLNLASERWSFSAVIEKNRALSWLDGLGRRRDDTPTKRTPAERGAQTDVHGG